MAKAYEKAIKINKLTISNSQLVFTNDTTYHTDAIKELLKQSGANGKEIKFKMGKRTTDNDPTYWPMAMIKGLEGTQNKAALPCPDYCAGGAKLKNLTNKSKRK